MSKDRSHSNYRSFYEREFVGSRYARETEAEGHSFLPTLRTFLTQHKLEGKRCLEIGAGRGALQHEVRDYVGVDLARAAGMHFQRPFFQASATALPFKDASFDAVWTYAALEHIPDPEMALAEMRRVLKPAGLLLLHAAWYCRSWAADGYPVRPFSDFDWRGKVIKASIPLRNSVFVRSAFVFPRRLVRQLEHSISIGPVPLRFRRLHPNYEFFWMSDSDAVVSIDPFDAILWFESRGDRCLSHPGSIKRFLVRTGAVTIRRASHP